MSSHHIYAGDNMPPTILTNGTTSSSQGTTHALEHEVLGQVQLSFWVIAGLLLASSVFFFLQALLVPRRWAHCMAIVGLWLTTAWYHYDKMRDMWDRERRAPVVYR